MICYRDMTFCNFYKKCSRAKNCHRPLTEEVLKQAKNWWGSFQTTSEPPISVYLEKPDCFKQKDKNVSSHL